MANTVGLQRPRLDDSGLYRYNTYGVDRSITELQNYFTQWARFDDSRADDPSLSFRIDLIYPGSYNYVNAFSATGSAPTTRVNWDTEEILANRVIEGGIDYTNLQIEAQQAGVALPRGPYDAPSAQAESLITRATGKAIVALGNQVERIHLRNAMATTSQVIHATGFGTSTGHKTLEEIATDSLAYMGAAGAVVPRILMIPPSMLTPLVGTRIRDYEGSQGSIRFLEGPDGFANPSLVGLSMMGLTIVVSENIETITYSAKTANTLTITKARTSNPRRVSIGNIHTGAQTVTLGEAFTFTGSNGRVYTVVLQDTATTGGLATGVTSAVSTQSIDAQTSGTESSDVEFIISDPLPDDALPAHDLTDSARLDLTPVAGNAGGTFYNCPIFVPGAYTIFRKNYQSGRILDYLAGVRAGDNASPILEFGYNLTPVFDTISQTQAISQAMTKFGGYILDGQTHENATSRDPKDIYLRHNFIGTTTHRNNMARLLVPSSAVDTSFNRAPNTY